MRLDQADIFYAAQIEAVEVKVHFIIALLPGRNIGAQQAVDQVSVDAGGTGHDADVFVRIVLNGDFNRRTHVHFRIIDAGCGDFDAVLIQENGFTDRGQRLDIFQDVFIIRIFAAVIGAVITDVSAGLFKAAVREAGRHAGWAGPEIMQGRIAAVIAFNRIQRIPAAVTVIRKQAASENQGNDYQEADQ